MSLYGSLTIKEWLALNCVTEDVKECLRKALEKNDEPMAVLALAELIKRGDIDLVTYAIQEAVDAGYFTLGSHFSTVFANALTNFGSRDPILRGIAKTVRIEGWPKTSEELLDPKYLSGPEQIEKAADLLEGTSFKACERLCGDERIGRFLESFAEKGWISVEVGFFTPDTEWDPHSHEHVPVNSGEHYNLTIKNGFILNREEIPNILSILDAEGIADPLPAFDGKELDLYTLVDGKWASPDGSKEDFFYVSYYSVE